MYTKATISGKICTGKSTLFADLQKILGWKTYSASQFFREYAKTHSASLQKAEEQNNDVTKEVDFRMQEMLKKQHHIILEGWMAGIMADAIPGVLKIFLTCDDTERAKRLAKRDSCSFKEAKQKIYEREESWRKQLVKIYDRNDFWDPKHYDLIIDTYARSAQDTLHLVLKTLGYHAKKRDSTKV